jgi:UDP-N-acetylmuramoyl-tripeptide--D-alanyl-D-alanine ligase
VIRIYGPISYAKAIAYMLQNTEYEAGAYMRWLLRATTARKIMYRRSVEWTRAARLFAYASGGLLSAAYMALAAYMYIWPTAVSLLIVAVIVLLAPFIVGSSVVVPLLAAHIFIEKPKQKRLIAEAHSIFAAHTGTKLAVVGSYGKTSMKEMLGHVLKTEKNVAISPANKNVASSHAAFARSLTGNEDVVVVEFGEGKPGDVPMFTRLVEPDMAVITGIAPAHLDKYGSMQNVVTDILSIVPYIGESNTYVNADSSYMPTHGKQTVRYSSTSTEQYTLSGIHIQVNSTSFNIKTAKHRYTITTGIVGRHTIGAMCAVILIAERLGVTKKAIESSFATLVPYEHRMQPRYVHGAWLLDDTYNGNIEGVKAGLAFLSELTAKRKLYVTPGLVDQGAETEAVHIAIGKLIAKAAPDVVVLMKNSATHFIQAALLENGFIGELHIEKDPLQFYTHIENFVAHGDVLLMQNDWPDNYA